ncbi:MAG: HAD family hydrolase [Nanoarchaeota archaeon]|nr:HAD family hydrolase [Nanoarchaeota archaeon]
MVKAVLFDFWGTLVENGVHSPIKQVRSILKITVPFSEYVIRMERVMMTSNHHSLRDAFIAVCKEFSIQCNEQLLEKLIGMWNKSWMLAQPYEEVQEVLERLGKKYTLILISNTDSFSIEKVMEKFNLGSYFKKIFFSYKVGMLKGERNFLKQVVDETGLKIEDCVVVGDSIQSDMMAAKRIGMKAVLLDRRETRDFYPKVKDLKELENILEKI